jgi:actin-like ATPase involved in cell morphogenesis
VAYWLGLDVGTTFSAAAVAADGRVEVVGLGHHAAAVPSVLFLREDGSFLVGDAALRRGLNEPGRLARFFKRRFGDSTPVLLGGSPWSADALFSQLVRFLVAEVAAQEGEPPQGVAVTHPANWGPFKTELLVQALRAAGVESALLLTEPEAAALQYAWRERVDLADVVGIYDLGGGTFDAAVLAHTGAGFELLGQAEGIERLGGIDFDEAVFGHVSGFLGPGLDALDVNDPATLSGLARLRADCVEAKEALSADTDVSIPVMLPQLQTEIRLTRAEFEAMIRPTLAETTAALGRAFRSAGVATEAVKAVLLVGGSSRIPLVGQLVAAEIGRPVAMDVHPKHAVALGAALAAAGWNGEPGSARIAAPGGASPRSAPGAPPPPPPTAAVIGPQAPAESGPVSPVTEAAGVTAAAAATRTTTGGGPPASARPRTGPSGPATPPPGNAEPPGPPPPAPPAPSTAHGPSGGNIVSRHRGLAIALAALAPLVAVAIVVLLTRGSGNKAPAAATTTTQPTVEATTTTSVVTSGSIAVPATQAWTDTSIDLNFGQHVSITATGTILHDKVHPESSVGPDGDPRLDLRGFNLIVNGSPLVANHGALVARIGDGDPFLIGAAHDFDVPAQGRLFLGVNDSGVANNAGSFQAMIRVTTT